MYKIINTLYKLQQIFIIRPLKRAQVKNIAIKPFGGTIMRKIKSDVHVKVCLALPALCLVVVFLITTCLFVILKGNVPNLYIEATLLPLLIISILMDTSYIFKVIECTKIKRALKMAKYYNLTLESLHNNVRCFKHDFHNIIQSIGGYIELNDIDGLKKFYTQLHRDCRSTNNLDLICSKFSTNPSIYGILADKLYTASKKHIQMDLSILVDTSKIKNNIYEISRILGILLDNAIEATDETEKKIICVTIKCDSHKYIFEIINTFTNQNVPIDKLFEKGFSTKENNSGIGLWEVHQILSKNTNLDLFTKIEDDKFIQQFEIYC